MDIRDCSTCKDGPENCKDSYCNFGQKQMGQFPGWTKKEEEKKEDQVEGY